MRKEAQRKYQEKRKPKQVDKPKSVPKKEKPVSGEKVVKPKKETRKELKQKKKSYRNKEFAKITYAFVGLFLCMMGYIVYFQVVESGDIINSPYNTRQDLLAEEVVRGNIYDANGNILAETVVSDDGTETRNYPYSNVFAHAIGYNVYGKSGVELTENFTLLTSHAFFMEKLSNEFQDEKDMGDSVYTTLDATVQQAAYDALGDYNGAVIVMEASTGKILAMVSTESYNPNKVSSDWSDLTTDDNSVLLNRATQGSYAPGSTFKTVTLLEYIRENPDYEDYTYTCTGSYELDGTTISCSNGSVHGTQTLEEAYANSCNAAFCDIGLQLDIENWNETATELLFNTELPGEVTSKSGSFTLSESDDTAQIMMTSIGQGDTLTNPYHLTLITAAIANGGKLMTPYLVESVENNTGSVVTKYSPSSYGDLMTSDEAKLLTDYMSSVVSSGTATALSGQSYTVAGKTGTAEYSSDKSKSHSWFTGFTNPDNPELVFTVIVEGSDGELKATTVVKKILDAYY